MLSNILLPLLLTLSQAAGAQPAQGLAPIDAEAQASGAASQGSKEPGYSADAGENSASTDHAPQQAEPSEGSPHGSAQDSGQVATSIGALKADAESSGTEGPVEFPPRVRPLNPALKACPPLPPLISGRKPFLTGEKLTYDLDVTGASAGSMTIDTLPRKGNRRDENQVFPVLMTARTNTFFSKVRDLNARIQSTMASGSLLPIDLREDFLLDGGHYRHEVTFQDSPTTYVGSQGKSQGGDSTVTVHWKNRKEQSGTDIWNPQGPALDYLSAFFHFRALDLKPGDELCADVLVLRRLWRLTGKVEGREHVSTPAGEFDVLHLVGTAVRHDRPQDTREVHYWVTDDRFRLPVAAMGVIDIGTLRAVLSRVQRRDLNLEPARAQDLKW